MTYFFLILGGVVLGFLLNDWARDQIHNERCNCYCDDCCLDDFCDECEDSYLCEQRGCQRDDR